MSCNQAWTCQELVDHADNWTLAGNVGLLKHMEQFAEDLFQQADKANNNLNDLLQELDCTEIRLDLVKNQFLRLQNTQFIESRVYEDDETLTEVVAEPTEPKLDEHKKRELLKTAVLDGLKVLDKYYERVSIPESDSEGDETDHSNYVLREKDPYINRPLPYVIGTKEWHTKWHAGLAESSDDDSDEEKDANVNGKHRVEDEFSDTSSESNLPVADRRFEAQLDNYTLNDTIDEEVNGNSISAKTPIANSTFAEQLAAKLDNVLTIPDDPEVNTKPIQKRQHTVPTSLIPHLPPEIPDEQLGSTSTGLFSDGNGLFDNHNDYDFEKPPPLFTSSSSAQRKVADLFDDDDDDDDFLAVPPPLHSPPSNKSSAAGIGKMKKQVQGLFDESSDDDGMFAPARVADQYIRKPEIGGPSFIPQEPPALDANKKPIGGVNVLGGFLPRKQKSSSSEASDDDISEKPPRQTAQDAKMSATFETESALVSKVKEASNIQSPSPPVANKPEKRVLSLFDDIDHLFEDDLFPPSPSISKHEKSNSASLFEGDNDEFDKNLDKSVGALPHPAPLTPNTAGIKPPEILPSRGSVGDRKAKTRDLFDESSEEEDDMFAVPAISIQPKSANDLAQNLDGDRNNPFKDDLIKSDATEVAAHLPHKIGDLPPELAASRARNFDKDLLSPVPKPRITSLFDEGPPLLSDGDWDANLPAIYAPAKNTDIVSPVEAVEVVDDLFEDFEVNVPRDGGEEEHLRMQEDDASASPAKSELPGKLKHNMNINVSALLPGAGIPRFQPEAVINGQMEFKDTDPPPASLEHAVFEAALSAEENVGGVKVLESVTKSRVKIPIKRRPSTRQGRKAALATSQSASENSQEKEAAVVDSVTEAISEASEVLSFNIDVEPNALPVVKAHCLPLSQDEANFKAVDLFEDVKSTQEGGKTRRLSFFDDESDRLFDSAFPSQSDVQTVQSRSPFSVTSTPCKQLVVEDIDDEDEALKPPPLSEAPHDDVSAPGGESVASVAASVPAAGVAEVKSIKERNLFDDFDDFRDSDDLCVSVAPSLARAADGLFAKKDINNVRAFDTAVSRNGNKRKEQVSIKEEKMITPQEGNKLSTSLFEDFGNDNEDDLFADARTQFFGFSSTSTSLNARKDTDIIAGQASKPKAKRSIHNHAEKQHLEAKQNKSLFGDDDDDETDLFGTAHKKPAKAIARNKLDKKPSLFDDDEDDDDIFANSSKRIKSAKCDELTQGKRTSGPVRGSSVVKNDPLADLFGDND